MAPREPARAHAQAEGALPTVSWVDDSAPAPAAPAALAGAEPDTAGRYRLGAELGRGATAVVHEATDLRLGRQVALKLLRPDASARLASAEGLIAEARSLARLKHPNVVAVHDVGTAGEQIFLVMELIRGRSLRKWLAGERRPWTAVARALADAGRGLLAAHQAGLVHRDFKPDNVLIGDDGGVRVVDFGLARPAEEIEGASLAGTAPYLAPEVIAGQSADAASDQYAFAVTAYEALFGRRPFAGKTLSELAAAAARGPAPPERSHGVPRALRAAILRGLGPAGERHVSLAPLVAALERAADRGRRRKLMLLGGGAALIVAAAAGLAVLVLGLGRAGERCGGMTAGLAGRWDGARRAAVERAFLRSGAPGAAAAWRTTQRALDGWAGRWTAARRGACLEAPREAPAVAAARTRCLDDKLSDLGALIDVLAGADPAVVRSASIAAAELPDLSLCASGSALLGQTPPPKDGAKQREIMSLRAELAQGEALRRVDQPGRAVDVAAGALARAHALGWAPLEAELRLLHGRALDDLGDHQAAERELKAALSAAERGRHDAVFVRAACLLAIQLGRVRGRIDEARHWVELAEAALPRLGPDPEATGLVHYTAGLTEAAARDYDAAGARYLRALAFDLTHFGPSHPSTGSVINGLAGALRMRGEEAQSLGWLYVARALDDGWSGAGPRPDAVTINIARSLVRRGDVAGALRELEAARAGVRPGMSPERHADFLHALSEVYSVAGREDEALAELEEALGVLERGLGPSSLRLAKTLERLGLAHMGAGRLAEAAKALERALEIREAAVGKDDPSLIDPLSTLANVAGLQNEVDVAESLAAQAVAIGMKDGGPRDSRMIQPLIQLASIHHQRGLYDAAARDARTALTIIEGAPPSARADQEANAVLASYLLGVAELGRGHPAQAAGALEAALTQAQQTARPTLPLPRLQFALARALWDQPATRLRARELAGAAAAALQGNPALDPEIAPALHKWRAAHR